jgi:DNA repair exonuclease SbcCD ATPase subunit
MDVENFLSIGNVSLSFENRGLVLIDGLNGSGKSSFFTDALCYGTTGNTIREIAYKDDVINRFVGRNCRISQVYRVDGVEAQIDTYRKHDIHKDEVFFSVAGFDRRGNSILDTREKIAKFLDMDFVSITNSAILGQLSTKYFPGLTDSEQKEILERLSGVTWISASSEISKQDWDNCQAAIYKLSVSLDLLSSRLIEISKDITSNEDQRLEFENQRALKIQLIRETMSGLRPSDTSVLENKIKVKQIEIAGLEKKLDRKIEVDKEIRALEILIGKLETSIENKNKEREKQESIIKNLHKLTAGEKCDVCGQFITQDAVFHYNTHLTEIQSKLEDEILEIEKQVETNKKLLAKWETEWETLDGFESRKTLLENDKKVLDSDLNQKKIENAKIEERIIKHKEWIAEKEKEINPYEGINTKLLVEQSQVKENKAKAQQELESSRDELQYHDFWLEGYSNRGLKSYIIESMIPQMNEWASMYSKVFGGKFNISFSVQKLTKKGDAREKFDVVVTNKQGSFNYSGNSGGERRLIDTIVMFVLGDLAASRTSKRFSLLILDEVFERLDESICDSVIRVLQAMVYDGDVLDLLPELTEKESEAFPKRESIFVLTHVDAFKSRFANRIHVFKDERNQTQLEDLGGTNECRNS